MKRFILTVSAMLAMAFSCFATNPESDFIYDMAPDGQGVMIKEYKGKSTTVVFPDTIEGLPVTQIGGSGFRVFKNKIPYNVTVPKSVKVIGENAFLALKGKIDIDLSNITSIGRGAFSKSDLSGTIKISKNLEFTGTDAFQETKITAVIIEEGVTSLGNKAPVPDGTFMNCPNLKSVTLPSTLTKIRGVPFNGCSALTEVIIPEGTKIDYTDEYTFIGCTSLSLATRAKIKASGYTGQF